MIASFLPPPRNGAKEKPPRPKEYWLKKDLLAAMESEKFLKFYSALKREDQKRRAKDLLPVLSALPETIPELYPAARRIYRHFILHMGPTNSGKTFAAKQRLKAADNGLYLGPLRLLAYEVCSELREGGVLCSLVTGEEEDVIPGASVQASTIEMADLYKSYDIAVIDEGQMIADRERGGSWTKAILGLCANEIHICFAPQAKDVIISLIDSCNDTYEIIEHERLVPLIQENKQFRFPQDLEEGDALIVFSRRDVHACAAELKELQIPCSIVYGNLPYDVRHREAEKFAAGDTKVVVATDAIGMGMNLPIKRVVFLKLEKFDGVSRRELFPEEVRQIAGRAGRFGKYDEGFFTCCESPEKLKALFYCKDNNITNVAVSFPETLLGIEGPISDTIRKWNKIQLPAGFVRQNMDEILKLVLQLEKKTDDKELIYRLAMLPFDIENQTQLAVWRDICDAEINGAHFCFPPQDVSSDLERLEMLYKKYDLLGNYYRVFGTEEELIDVLREKLIISKRISKLLEKQPYAEKHCKYCKKKLSFFYPYSVCKNCRYT
ncbi:MAG: hypothetical protein J1E34_08940 [Oscillospiraceae bacterium]|nr:hypothetical protein [Oscillospiraceae bacterium]